MGTVHERIWGWAKDGSAARGGKMKWGKTPLNVMFEIRTTQENAVLIGVWELLIDDFGDGGYYNKEDLKQNLYLKCNVCNKDYTRKCTLERHLGTAHRRNWGIGGL